MNENIEDHVTSLRTDMTEVVRSVLNVKEDKAFSLAEKFVDAMRDRLGGSSVYIPAKDKTTRDAAISKEYDGTNIGKVCSKHNVSKATVFRAIKRCRGGGFKV